VNAVTIYGVIALTFMMLMYAWNHGGDDSSRSSPRLRALEHLRLREWRVPFGVVEAVWSLIAVRRAYNLG